METLRDYVWWEIFMPLGHSPEGPFLRSLFLLPGHAVVLLTEDSSCVVLQLEHPNMGQN